MNRSESNPNLAKKSLSKYSGSNYQPASYYGPQSAQFNPYLNGTKSEKSIDGSVRSYNAVEGSLRGSSVSFNSAISGPSRKSEKSVLSNYPQAVNKQTFKAPIIELETQQNAILRKAANVAKNVEQNPNKKTKIEKYIDQDYFYSSQFKRNFVRGVLALARSKNIQDMSLLLKEVSPTIMVRPDDLSIWVSAFLLIFQIEHKLRRIRSTQQNIFGLIEDHLVQFMKENRDIKKARLIKIVVYMFKELPVHKTKVLEWFENFVRENRHRIVGVDLSKYADLSKVYPPPINYDNLSKSSIIKSKQSQKKKEAEQRSEKEKNSWQVQAIKARKKEQPVQEESKQSQLKKEKIQNKQTKPIPVNIGKGNETEVRSVLGAPSQKKSEKVPNKRQTVEPIQPEQKLSLEELISQRIDLDLHKSKPKGVKQAPHPSIENKNALKQKIKNLARDRQEELKEQSKSNGKGASNQPENKKVSDSEQEQREEDLKLFKLGENYSVDESEEESIDENFSDDSYVGVSGQEEEDYDE